MLLSNPFGIHYYITILYTIVVYKMVYAYDHSFIYLRAGSPIYAVFFINTPRLLIFSENLGETNTFHLGQTKLPYQTIYQSYYYSHLKSWCQDRTYWTAYRVYHESKVFIY